MLNFLIIFFGKTFIKLSKKLNLGNGSTWPGHIALSLNENFIKQTLGRSKTKLIIVAGTNGKTTTSKMLVSILMHDEKKVLQNQSGANLLNGLASTIISGAGFSNNLNYDFLVFEADENVLPLIVETVTPSVIVGLNLFRDQLDRYGEIDTILKKWKKSFEELPASTTLILNADDPQVSFLGFEAHAKVEYFGLEKITNGDTLEHGADSIYCPKCSSPLSYNFISFSHLGDWYCKDCKLKRPTPDITSASNYPLTGVYNKYNTLASCLTAKMLNINQKAVNEAFKNFTPAFGRQEKIKYGNKNAQLFLSKNPTSFNESLKTISELNAGNILIILNDRVPDGLDVSWIWDINTTPLSNIKNIIVSGDRVFDMALRLRYAGIPFEYESDLKLALKKSFEETPANETLFILPTYSAMLDTRKILKGRKIL